MDIKQFYLKVRRTLILSALLFLTTAFYLKMDSNQLVSTKYEMSSRDYILVHFVHGSIPLKDCSDQRIRVGGRWGGHVEVQVDDQIFGFKYNKSDIHWTPRRRPGGFNSEFTAIPLHEWKKGTQLDKVTSFRIPVHQEAKGEIKDIYQQYHQALPYDYAFFGMRCTSSVYEVLAQIGVFPSKSRLACIVNNFYPRQLRERMIQWAENNELEILKKDGINCRIWD